MSNSKAVPVLAKGISKQKALLYEVFFVIIAMGVVALMSYSVS